MLLDHEPASAGATCGPHAVRYAGRILGHRSVTADTGQLAGYLIALQAGAGNRAVQRLLAGQAPVGPAGAPMRTSVSVQRCGGEIHSGCTCAENDAAQDQPYRPATAVQRVIGDGHDLASPRFAGEPTLEACYDDEARLTIGSAGPAVQKVQQALLDLGYDLGPKQADSVYGRLTWDAVKQFKKDQQLGWEHMGDVGSGTMTRLDQLFGQGGGTGDGGILRGGGAGGAGPVDAGPSKTEPTMTPEEYEASAAALCLGDKYNTGPPTRAFSSREQSRISATRWAALGVAGRAVLALSSHDRYMRTLARRILHDPNPDLDQLAGTARRIYVALATTPVVCGTCTNQVCTHSGGGSPLADADNGIITICPYFFHPSISAVEQRRTWLHEAGHIAGIDDPPPGTPYQHPPYCPQDTAGSCDNPCPSGDKNNVDNWARFLECVAFAY